jgi:hypothetical protein
MKKALWVFILMMGLSSVTNAQMVGRGYPFQLSLFPPIAILGSDQSVQGLRLNLLYGVNEDVSGLDLGILNRTLNNQRGVQFGLYNRVQNAVMGVQIGGLNMSRDVRGLQFGVLNWADRLSGLQIGVLNFAWNNETFKVLPIVNASW